LSSLLIVANADFDVKHSLADHQLLYRDIEKLCRRHYPCPKASTSSSHSTVPIVDETCELKSEGCDDEGYLQQVRRLFNAFKEAPFGVQVIMGTYTLIMGILISLIILMSLALVITKSYCFLPNLKLGV
ncbi:hypothetical protein PFISCL1PPCAC_23661, partial [Pristionchus fissidentatus]